MFGAGFILGTALAYLALLFAVAYYAERRANAGRSIISNPYIYTLSIAVYCTAWTFYGSVGRAAETGAGFLPIYLGPTLMAGLWWFVLRKIIRIAKRQRITSIADFIGSRYGKSASLGGLVTVIAVVGILPYISLQLKAVASSFEILRQYPELSAPQPLSSSLWRETALYIALALAAFTILFGTRRLDITERHEGMVAAIAFESLFKLIAFVAVGVFVTFVVFDGPGDIFTRAAERPDLAELMRLESLSGGYAEWVTLTVLSMAAILFLPRQFQVAVVENVDEGHMHKAVWLFPLYLLVINLFVLPLAFGGLLRFPEGAVDPDTFVLTIPMAEGQPWLALIVFLGGLSAATGMVIVATIALATMVCNDLVVPILLRARGARLDKQADLSGLLLTIRRITIVLVLILGYLYFRVIGESYALVSIGLVSFAAAAQFAPAILFGLYWRGASRLGAFCGLCAGFGVWTYTLLLPALAKSGWLAASFVEAGPLGIELLRPYALFGLDGLDIISHAVLWSLLANVGTLLGVSAYSRRSAIERLQADLFVNALRSERRAIHLWHSKATVEELQQLMGRFMGAERAAREIEDFEARRGHGLDPQAAADPELVAEMERVLAGALGAASARAAVSSAIGSEVLGSKELMQVLDETSQAIEHSQQLEEKSQELERASAELRAANARLREVDRLKDEFVSTVSHELRTPLTSIRAVSEILLADADMDLEQRRAFLHTVVTESERLSRLINEILDLSKIEAGHDQWQTAPVPIHEVATQAVAAVAQLFDERRIRLEVQVPAQQPLLVRADHDRLVQVLINLLSNAAKFCEPDSGQVRLHAAAAGAKIRVSVIDNGPGIPQDQRRQIFERFRQVHSVAEGKPAGTGLGLAICQRIVEHHGGRIWVDSEEGQGSNFTFELPAAGPSHESSEKVA